MATEETSSYGGAGGTGGKFRKRPHRRPQTTPYDRPPPPPTTNAIGKSWFSKIIDPASKFISARASGFFSNLVKRPALLTTESEHESRDEPLESVPNNRNGPQEPGVDLTGNLTNSSDGNGILELEQMLKQKIFTRSEINRLTELLHSRTVNFPIVDEDKINERNLLKSLSDPERHPARISVQENNNKFQSSISTPIGSRVREEDIGSPTELAKAYMGSRPSKVSPSMLALRSQALNEKTPLVKLSSPSLSSKSVLHVGLRENGFTTPRSRGRSAIYSMARTPYSRGTGSTNYSYGVPSSSSQSALEQYGQFGFKNWSLKRRRYVLDDNTGSAQAMRSIRQKPNLLYRLRPLTTSGAGVGYRPSRQDPLTQKPLYLDDAKNKISKVIEESGDDGIASSSYSVVPSQSRDMATKILQQLEMFTPKDKSLDSKLIMTRNSSPAKLTQNMLHGRALRSLEDLDGTKFFQEHDVPNVEDSSKSRLNDFSGLTFPKQSKLEENGPKETEVVLTLSTSNVGNDVTISTMKKSPQVQSADDTISEVTVQPRRAFRMSAHEDFLEMDDEIHANGLVSQPLAEGREELQISGKAVPTEVRALEKTPVNPVLKTPEGNTSDRKIMDKSDGLVTAKENAVFHIPASPAPSSASQQVMPTESISAADKPKDSSLATTFGLNSNNVCKVPSSPFPSTATIEASGVNSGTWLVPRPESLNSYEKQPKHLESDKGDDKSTQKDENVIAASDISATAPPVSASENGFFSSVVPATTSNTNYTIVATAPSGFSATPTMASSDLMKQNFNNGSTIASSFTNGYPMSSAGTVTIPDNGPSSSVAQPSSSASPISAPIFSFGSSSNTPTLAAACPLTTAADVSDIKTTSRKETAFGSLSKPSFGAASFVVGSTGANPFAFTSSVSNQSIGVASVSQSIPFQFGLSGSSSVFGTSGITSFASNSSVAGSSFSAAKPFTSGENFAFGSSTSSSEANTNSSTSAAGSSIFSSSWQTSKPPAIASSSTPSSGFLFGSSSSSIATNSAPMVFGLSTSTSSSSMFSFTSATSTSSSLVSASQTQPLFGSTPFKASSVSQSQPLFGSTTAFKAPGNNGDQMNMEDSMAEDPVSAASTPAAPLFGQHLAAPSAVPGFMFGATASLPSHSVAPFQFGGQVNAATSHNLSPFQASSSLDFSAGGSFSLGSGGGGVARKNVRISKTKNRKK